MPSHFPDVRVVNLDCARVYIVKAHKQIDKRCFSAAGGADYCNALAAFDLKVKVFNERTFFNVAERNRFKADISVDGRTKRIFRLGRLIFRFKNLLNSSCAGERILKFRNNAAYFVERLCVLICIAEENAQSADGDYSSARNAKHCSEESNDCIDNVVDKPCARICKA